MIIEQTIEITENGVLRLRLPLPPEIPVGARVNVIVKAEPGNSRESIPHISTREDVERCWGLGKRMGSRLTSDMVIETRRGDRELEEAKYQRLHGKSDGEARS